MHSSRNSSQPRTPQPSKTEGGAPGEVVRLHGFFDAWYNGQDGISIGQFADAMDPQFTIVSPDGRVLRRDAIIEAVHDGFGRGGIAIAVENFEVVERNAYVVCRYDEVHTTASVATTRVSTAVMESDSDTPGGYRWITVHETWAPA